MFNKNITVTVFTFTNKVAKTSQTCLFALKSPIPSILLLCTSLFKQHMIPRTDFHCENTRVTHSSS